MRSLGKQGLAGLFGALAWVALGGAAAAQEGSAVAESKAKVYPTLLIIQGKLKDGGEEAYRRYLAGTGPLLVKYRARVAQVGEGLASALTTEAWPINAVLEFPDRQAAEGFLGDPRYLEIKEELRDTAYEELHLTLVASRAPMFRSSEDVAREAFEDFRRGLASGEWQPFLGRLAEDFTFRFPSGRFQGTHVGREKAREFFTFVSQAFPGGLEILEVEAVTAQDDRVIFEFHDRGELRGKPYENHVAIAFEVCGEEICGYREYFGLVGPPPEP